MSVILSVFILVAENARNRVTGVGKDANVKKKDGNEKLLHNHIYCRTVPFGTEPWLPN